MPKKGVMNIFIRLANQALLLTNLFVFTYKILLKLLNSWFPPVVNLNFLWKELFAPEPFEIPLYLLLSFIFVFIIFLIFRWRIIKNQLLTSNFLGWIVFLFLFLIFLLNIGGYPLKNDVQFIENLANPTTSVLILSAYLI